MEVIRFWKWTLSFLSAATMLFESKGFWSYIKKGRKQQTSQVAEKSIIRKYVGKLDTLFEST